MTNRWLMLAVIFLARICMGFQFQSVAAVATFIVDDVHLGYAQVGALMGLYMLPGVLIALPGGLLAQRFPPGAVSAGGLALMVVGAELIARASGFPLAGAGRVVSGVGGILLNVALAKMVADWFTGRELSTAMGVMLASFPAGLGLAAALLGPLARAFSWRAAAEATAVASAAALVLVLALYRNPPGVSGHGGPDMAPNPPTLALARRDVILALSAGVVWALFNASFIVFASFAPAFLIAGGASVGLAGLLMSAAIWISIVSAPLGGYANDRLGRANAIIVASTLLSALLMLAVLQWDVPALWFPLIGASLGIPAGPLMTLLPRALAPAQVAAGFGVYYTVFYLGLATAQPLAGVVRDVSGSPAMPLVVAALVMLATMPALALFRVLERRLPA